MSGKWRIYSLCFHWIYCAIVHYNNGLLFTSAPHGGQRTIHSACHSAYSIYVGWSCPISIHRKRGWTENGSWILAHLFGFPPPLLAPVDSGWKQYRCPRQRNQLHVWHGNKRRRPAAREFVWGREPERAAYGQSSPAAVRLRECDFCRHHTQKKEVGLCWKLPFRRHHRLNNR